MSSLTSRYHSVLPKKQPDHRSETDRDIDRILYSAAFRRLSGVTQVASTFEGEVIHHRMIHSLKVAQIARRVAEKLQAVDGAGSDVVDPSAAEAAGLAHDLGHPPFGHIGEEVLNYCMKDYGGFEGNAQSFRVVNTLTLRGPEHNGLNLTKRTLAGILKYPWFRQTVNDVKWGAYQEEEEMYHFARGGLHADERSVEASVMDWADDITYAIHDVDDFFRAGLIPLNLLALDDEERARFFLGTQQRWNERNPANPKNVEDYRDTFFRLIRGFPLSQPFDGDRTQQGLLRGIGALLIGEYVNATSVGTSETSGNPVLTIDEEKRKEVQIIKELNWHYVVESAALKTQQYGQARLVEDLWTIYANEERADSLIPGWINPELDHHASPQRRAADIVASLTDQQVVKLHQRLQGTVTGSVRDWF